MNIREFRVHPSLPENLQPLADLAFNLRWSWDPDTIDVFRRLDRNLWESCGHNPVLLLGRIEQSRLVEASRDEGMLTFLGRVLERHHNYMRAPSWFERTYPDLKHIKIAYFCAEFGISECLPIYSGGLGALAGDHLKSASDLGLPLLAVGLLYQCGYFHQYLNNDGWQQESTPVNDFFNMPLRLVRGEDGSPLKVDVPFPGRTVLVQVWQIDVGRVPLYLLDTNVAENGPEDRNITDQLYGGDTDKRIRQEIVLGVGGIKALDMMGIRPQVCHMNEGHSAFLGLERIRRLMERRELSFEAAREATTGGNIFTTHTSVPAGFDRFPPELMDKYFHEYWDTVGLNREQFLALGREDPSDQHGAFNMAILALRLAGMTNGVSRIHASVSRRILGNAWPGVPVHEVPICHVTNGVHVRTWVSRDMGELLQRYAGGRWLEDAAQDYDWSEVGTIPDEELWQTHERRRERLVASARRRVIRQIERRGASRSEIEAAREVLHPGVLTIGFARRFATYKRATLILRDPERLKRLLTDKSRPIQIIFAGKAHPHDHPGKELIRHIVHAGRDPEIHRRLVFLEDYDLNLAREMVQGVDVWLNTPRRLMEASGTSGMKAALNGAINLSVLDGWWLEGYSPDVGWAIGAIEQYEDLDYQDTVESKALYDILEHEVIPFFYERGADNLPRKWIALMKNSMRNLGPRFNSHRTLREYSEKLYVPIATRWETLRGEGEYQRAKALAAWKRRIRAAWKDIRLESLDTAAKPQLKVGDEFEIQATFSLGELSTSDLSIEIYHGKLDEKGAIMDGGSMPLVPSPTDKPNSYRYGGKIPCETSGRWGYAIRVVPKHDDLVTPYDLGLISWF
jgi:starch phosphorylase